MLKIINLRKSFGNLKALDNVSLDIPKSGIFALLGINGAGKTTLVSILCSILKKDGGEVFYDGEDFFSRLKNDKTLCSLCPQEFAFYPTLTVRENVDFFSSIADFGARKRKELIEFALEFAQLENHLNVQAKLLSGGLKRRLNLALSLLNDPQILFLDEPTVGIDPRTREFILRSIKRLSNQKRLIIYTSHYMNEVDFLNSGGAIIDKGKILSAFDAADKRKVLLIELENEQNFALINEFAAFKNIGGAYESREFDEQRVVEFLHFAKTRKIALKSHSFAPLSTERLFLELTDKELI